MAENILQKAQQPSILIVDDEPQNIHLLGQCLKDKYQILIATSGQQAIEKMSSPPYPDMILLDIVMPEINGFDVCRKIKNSAETKDIPIIFVSAKNSDTDEAKGLELGAVDFISKPFSPTIVQARVKTHFSLQNQKQIIQQSEALLKITLESTKDGMIVFDKNGTVLELNQNFVTMWQLPEDILLDKKVDKIIEHGLKQLADPETALVKIQELLSSDTIETDILTFKDERVFSRYSAPLFQGKIKLGRVACYTDITEQKTLESQLRKLSITDPLTGLYNRRKLHEIIDDELQRAQRYQQEISLLMIDIDHFKHFNDQYGHERGDHILQNVAAAMKKHFRNVDWCCRFGGEEFCVILPDSDLPGTVDAAERFRQLIDDMDCDGLHVTISIGAAMLSNLNKSAAPEELITQADKALYKAKAAGRNQVQLYSIPNQQVAE
jgi:diguanylate cyclase (GGDEF)-like protein/PAS domain S-box-containing protein